MNEYTTKVLRIDISDFVWDYNYSKELKSKYRNVDIYINEMLNANIMDLDVIDIKMISCEFNKTEVYLVIYREPMSEEG